MAMSDVDVEVVDGFAFYSYPTLEVMMKAGKEKDTAETIKREEEGKDKKEEEKVSEVSEVGGGGGGGDTALQETNPQTEKAGKKPRFFLVNSCACARTNIKSSLCASWPFFF